MNFNCSHFQSDYERLQRDVQRLLKERDKQYDPLEIINESYILFAEKDLHYNYQEFMKSCYNVILKGNNNQVFARFISEDQATKMFNDSLDSCACKKCKEVKLLSEFHIVRTYPSGKNIYTIYCKQCYNERQKEYRGKRKNDNKRYQLHLLKKRQGERLKKKIERKNRPLYALYQRDTGYNGISFIEWLRKYEGLTYKEIITLVYTQKLVP